MKKNILIGLALLGVLSAQAAVLSDDFNRTNTGWDKSSNPSVVGADWRNGDLGNSYWSITGNRVDARTASWDQVLYNDALQTTSGNGTSFTVSLDVRDNVGSSFAGVAFNVQDGDHFYFFRFRSGGDIVQFGIKDGDLIANRHGTGTFVTGTDYTLTVTSSEPYVFDCEIKETSSGTVLFSSIIADSGSSLTGGYAGIYQGYPDTSATRNSFDNFRLEVGSNLPPGSDDFNRPDSALSADGSTVGPDWSSSRTTGGWGITGQRLVVNMVEQDSVLFNTSLPTTSGNGTNFTLNLDVMALQNYSWAGVAFNYQDPINFYFFRYKGGFSNYQMYRVVNGSLQSIVNKTIPGTFALNTDYTLSVSSSDPYVFDYEIRETGSGSVVVSGLATDGNATFSGGYAGVYQTTVGAGRNSFDNFSLVLSPVVSAPENNHLIVPDSDVAALQAKVASPEFSYEWSRFLARADRLCDPNSWEYADPNNVTDGYQDSSHKVPRRLIYWMQTLGMAYRLSGDTKYRDHGTILAVNSAQELTLNSVYMAAAQSEEGAKGDLMRGLATGYDFFADHMSGLQRAQLLQTTQEYLDDYIATAQDPLTWWIPYHNYGGVCGGAAGLVALQQRDVDPTAAEADLQEVLLLVKRWLETGFDDQGAYFEGELYSVYGLENVVLLADVLKRDGGEDLFTHSTLHNVLDFYFQCTLPGEKVHDARNDSVYQNPGEILLKLASEYGNGVSEWLYETRKSVDQYSSWGPGCSFFLQVLWESGLAPVTPKAAGEPLGKYFEGRGLSTWRTGWDTTNVFFAVEAGKYHNVTHDQADEGHFTLYGYGNKWACDPGYGNNQSPGSKAQAVAHNGVLIDGVGQALSGAGIGTTGKTLEYRDTSVYGYALMDCSDAYRRYYSFLAQDRLIHPDGVPNEQMTLDHAYRHTLFIRETATTPAYAVVLDNISKDGNAHDYRWQMLSWSDLYYSALSGSSATIAPSGGGAARMFVFLDAETPVTLSQDTYDYNTSSWPRLKGNCTAANPYFSAVLVPTGTGISPTVTFSNTPLDRIIHVQWPGKMDRIIWRKDALTNAVQVLHGEPGYTAWAGEWGGDIGADTDDPDHDGTSNLYEFGLNGDPTNPANRGTLPVYEIIGNEVRVIHPLLADPESGLDYRLELCTNLIAGAWVDAGYVVAGTNRTGGALDFVTNTTGMAEHEKFIRLILE